MTNIERYIQAFTEAFEVTSDQAKGLQYRGIPIWDSIGHMGLIAALESKFNITLDPDDIVDLSSFEKGKEILAKYKIDIIDKNGKRISSKEPRRI